ncbi:MAG: type II toxin-antitoxin system RelE/ParE family toxin [Oscillospiraceae bacterium]|nr:type II toxin-antitoxin system RelE/ParE family toxin [Oscillospiraceae bacterium]
MKHYQVEITNQALSDIEAIYDHIATVFHAPDTAIKQYNRIAEGIESLEILPERCRLLESQPEREQGIHQLPYRRAVWLPPPAYWGTVVRPHGWYCHKTY